MRVSQKSREIASNIEELIAKFPPEIADGSLKAHRSLNEIDAQYKEGDREALINLNSNLKYALLDFKRCEHNFDVAYQRAIEFENL